MYIETADDDDDDGIFIEPSSIRHSGTGSSCARCAKIRRKHVLSTFCLFLLLLISTYFNNLYLDKETDPHHNHRLQLAGPTLSIRCMMTFDEKRTQEAFSYCRLAVANQEELADIQVSHLLSKINVTTIK